MFGTRLRAENRRLILLAASRAERLASTTKYAEITTRQKRQLQRRHDEVLNIIAIHITGGATSTELQNAMLRAGFRAELEYALLGVAPNTQAAVTRAASTTRRITRLARACARYRAELATQGVVTGRLTEQPFDAIGYEPGERILLARTNTTPPPVKEISA